MSLNRRLEHWYRSLSLAQQWLSFLGLWVASFLLLDLILAPMFGWQREISDVLRWFVIGSVIFFLIRWHVRRQESRLPPSGRSDDQAPS
jgi:hypothetical protein